jgi:hypothetical protein
MNLHLPRPLLGRRASSDAARPTRPDDECRHVVESDFSFEVCRFVLTCSCGDAHETRYIDEALEWRELHLSLAPLADRLAAGT